MRAWWTAPLSLGLIVTTAGCGETQGQRATTGALGGIAFGTAVGGPIGAVIGGAAGAGAGAERGNEDQLVNAGAEKAEAAVGWNSPANTASTASRERAPRTASAGAPPPRRTASRDDLRDAQKRLTSLGLYKGPIDGLYGPQTAAALNDFQAQNGLPMGGQLTRATQQRLQSATAPGNEPQPNPPQAPPESAQPPANNPPATRPTDPNQPENAPAR